MGNKEGEEMTDPNDWPADGTCRQCGAAPRHPANGLCATCEDEQACTSCGGTGIDYQTEKRCACQPATIAKARPAPTTDAQKLYDALDRLAFHVIERDGCQPEHRFSPIGAALHALHEMRRHESSISTCADSYRDPPL